MLISLDKNRWLYDWMQEEWHQELSQIIFNEEFDVPRPNQIRSKIALLLESKGYKTKVTSKFDIIISISEEQYVFLKLKYY